MLNDRFDANAHGDKTPDWTPSPSAAARDGARGEAETFADREVPLVGVRPVLAVQQWLDGDATETVARAASPADVDVWSALGAAYAEKAQLMAPAGLADRIMAALPASPQPTGVLEVAPRAD
jgi:hypothetical protein